MTDQNSVAIIFSKNPVEGDVKTRLIPEWGTEGALKIYKDILKKTIETVKQSKASEIYVFCTPDLNDPFMNYCSKQYELKLGLQLGKDLGERMTNAFLRVLEDFSSAIIVGCDCPELTSKDIDKAITRLNEGIDVVLGPSEDGGYYLIGLNKLRPNLFQGIPWGSGEVLSATRKRIDTMNLHKHELETKWDLDLPEDVHRYFRSRV